MFFLSQLEHKLRLPPQLLDLPLDEAIRGELQSIFVDKVIAKLGLCISVYDIKSVDGGFVLPNEGQPTYTASTFGLNACLSLLSLSSISTILLQVMFRMIIFRPVVGEIIAGKLDESSATGLRISLGFFDDIQIPPFLFPQPSQFRPMPENPEQLVWVWKFNDEDFVVEEDSKIRFKVSDVKFPPIPLEQEEGAKAFAPMVVYGSIDGDGLGPISWWA